MQAIPLASLSVLLLACADAAAQAPLRLSRNLTNANFATGYDVDAGDVDGDGDIDLVVANDHDDNQLLLNDGRGTFVDATAGRLLTPQQVFPGGYNNASYQVDLADIDGDGDLDLLVINDHDIPNRVYTNDGTGTFTDVTATAIPPAMEWSLSQAVGDFDGDGDVDWFVGNAGLDRLYLNNGLGTFTDVSASNLPPNGILSNYRTQAADVDGDGDLDLIVDASAGNPCVYLNDGNAVFAPAPASAPIGSGLCYAVDLDGDGLPELLTDNGSMLYRNLGGMAFAPAVALPEWTYGAADVDGDGDLDLLASGVVLANDGLGNLTSVPCPDLTFGYVGRFTTADVDGDGDTDVVRAAWGANRVLANFTTQLQTPAAPQIGQPYTIELHAGPASQPALFGLGVAAAGGNYPLPGLGTLRLDLSQGQLVDAFVSAGPVANVTWTIPNNPALAGFELHYQAVVATPSRPLFLGNAVRDVVQ